MSPQPVVCIAESAEAANCRRSPTIAGEDAVPITIPSTAVRAYLRSFGAIAIVAYADGSIGCTKDIGRPLRSKPIAVWWAPNAALAIEVVRQCQAEESSDVTSVAYGLNIRLTAHDVAIANAQRALDTA
jgi:hypothetical protein